MVRITWVIIGLVVIALIFFFLVKVAHAPMPSSSLLPSTKPTASLANPASVNCEKVGGNLTIRKDGSGGEYGLCNFSDNRSCEEWALYRGDCPIGGVKTTGFDTIAQKYCAWLGGKTLAIRNATCTFLDGSVCDDEKLFMGTCRKGDSLQKQ